MSGWSKHSTPLTTHTLINIQVCRTLLWGFWEGVFCLMSQLKIGVIDVKLWPLLFIKVNSPDWSKSQRHRSIKLLLTFRSLLRRAPDKLTLSLRFQIWWQVFYFLVLWVRTCHKSRSINGSMALKSQLDWGTRSEIASNNQFTEWQKSTLLYCRHWPMSTWLEVRETYSQIVRLLGLLSLKLSIVANRVLTMKEVTC